MRNVLYFILLLLIFALSGCRTHRIVEKQILHDSIYITKDNVIYKYEKDSVQEKEKVHIYTKHDTLLNTDSVFIVREKFVNRWKIRTDTITKVAYIYKGSKASTEKEEKKGTGLLEKYTLNIWKSIKVMLVLALLSVILFRDLDKLFWLMKKLYNFLRK